jgi:hypothetical protein
MTVVVQQDIEAGDEQDARDAFEVFENLLIVVPPSPYIGLI